MLSVVVLACSLAFAAAAPSIPPELYSPLITQKLLAVAQNFSNPSQYPEYTTPPPYGDQIGRWVWFPTDTWTNGFFPAAMMLLAERAQSCSGGQLISASDAATALGQGRTWSAPLVTLETGSKLGHDVGNGNSSAYRDMAISHADKTIQNHVRADGSTFHVVVYNSTDGAVIAQETHQGYSNTSTWTRGQAWAMYGFTSMYNRTGLSRYLDTARQVSQFYVDHLPTGNSVPPWDFDAPLSPTPPRDTSSATVASSAMLLLSQMETSIGNSTGSAYWTDKALTLLTDTISLAWRTEPEWQAVLSNGTSFFSEGVYDTGLTYGDYYFVKAGNILLDMGLANCNSGMGSATPACGSNCGSTPATIVTQTQKSGGVRRPHFGSVGVPVAVYTNNFKANIPNAKIYQYDVGEWAPYLQQCMAALTTYLVILPTGKVYPSELTMKIIRAMQESNPDIFTPKGVYDGRAIFYSPKNYPFPQGRQEVGVGDRGDFKVRLTIAATINPETLLRYIQGEQSHDESVLTAINACNVAVRMEPIQNNPFNVRSFFTPDERRPLGRGIELWRGYFQSVRPAIGRMVVNLDISTGTFYKGGPLIGLCLEFLGAYGQPELHLTARMDGRRRNDLIKFIRNLKVKTQKRGEGPKIRPIKDLSKEGASDHMFPTTDGAMTTVAAFFSLANGRALTHPKVLSVKAYVPMELCEVVEGQPMRKQVPSDLVKGVLDFSTSRPEQRLRSIMNGLQVLQYGSSSYLQDFGIDVDPSPMLIQGRVLPTPTLQYGGSEIRPANGQWNMRDRKLWKPVQIMGCVMINYDNRFDQQSQRSMIEGLEEACRSVGITGMTRSVPILQKDPMGTTYSNHLKEAAQLYRKEVGSMPNLVIVVLPDRGNEDIYYRIKKINVKLGGINVIPKASSVQFLTDPSNPTLVLGCDVMHPTPGAGYRSRPSFTALTGNIDSSSSRFIATSRAQKAGQEMVEDLEEMVSDVLGKYMAYRRDVEKKKILAPRRVIFYRDGVSEGQFKQVVEIEVPRIKSAFAKAKILPPKLTVVIVGKRHHNRFFPANQKDADKSGNAPAGLVIDREITNPLEFDFFLQSHGGLLGTSRSAHYSCLVDENSFTADDLQQLSFSLCHVYARATRSVSIVAPTYYADTVCARAKHHYDPDGTLADLSDTASQMSSEAAEAQMNLYKERFKPLHPGTAQNMYFQ
ncbi:hypothetical protein FRB97_009030 [Tulasnella sp. 331]|nr:hypothetical protein FRB97_009030 [Tulasnella sp. 331]